MNELEEYYRWLSILGYSEQRVKQYPRAVEIMLEWTGKEVKGLTKRHLTDYVFYLKTRTKHGELLKPSYVNTQITAIRTFARFLKQSTGYHLPTGHLLYCKVKQNPPNVLSEKEIQELYSITTNSKYGYRDRAMLAVCYGAGLRRREAIHLRVGDIDVKRGYVHVREGKNYKERIVPLPPKAIQDIKDYLKHGRPLLKKGKHYQRELFLGYRGKAITDQVFEKRMHQLAALTKNETLIAKRPTLHTLRHSIATHLLYRGVALKQVSQFLGHASLGSTQVYTHIKPP